MQIIYENQALRYEDWALSGVQIKIDYRIAIPSYKRVNCIQEKTLKILKEANIPSEIIDIFVADEKEKQVYEKNIDKSLYGNIIIGKVGMKAIRNYIQNYYPEGKKIICLDDDISQINQLKDKKNFKKVSDLKAFFSYAFYVSKEIGARYWGVYAVNNPFFMDNSIACGLRYLEGAFWGFTVNHDKRTFVTLDDKEDFERSIRAYLVDGTVARFDFISFKSNFYKEKGGMQVERTEERITNSAITLTKMFPNQCKINTSRKKHLEVKLVEQRKEYKNKANLRIKLM